MPEQMLLTEQQSRRVARAYGSMPYGAGLPHPGRFVDGLVDYLEALQIEVARAAQGNERDRQRREDAENDLRTIREAASIIGGMNVSQLRRES